MSGVWVKVCEISFLKTRRIPVFSQRRTTAKTTGAQTRYASTKLKENMKEMNLTSKLSFRRLLIAMFGVVLLMGCTSGALAQSVGVNFVNSGSGGVAS